MKFKIITTVTLASITWPYIYIFTYKNSNSWQAIKDIIIYGIALPVILCFINFLILICSKGKEQEGFRRESVKLTIVCGTLNILAIPITGLISKALK